MQSVKAADPTRMDDRTTFTSILVWSADQCQKGIFFQGLGEIATLSTALIISKHRGFQVWALSNASAALSSTGLLIK